jgi:hypothetical protein
MSQLFPPEIIENTVECYHARIRTRTILVPDLFMNNLININGLNLTLSFRLII